MNFEAGRLLKGRYHIEAQLGKGGMGAVYRAFDTLHDGPCAVKEFRLGYLPSEDQRGHQAQDTTRLRSGPRPTPVTREQAIEQFKLEAKLLARLDHPNLPKVRDYFAEGENYYLVMELIEGQNLAEMLEHNGSKPFPEERVLSWMGQVMDALAYCHRMGVIHRDIKPANVIVTSSGKVYLVDFGTAKPDPESKTVLGSYTSGYSPPEQYSRVGRTDERSDIYALGATMYTLLTGQEPSEAPDRLARENSPSPRRVVGTVSPAVDAAVVQAMELQSEKRFQDVASFRSSMTKSTHARQNRGWLAVPVFGLMLALVVVWLLAEVNGENAATPTAVATMPTLMSVVAPTDTSVPRATPSSTHLHTVALDTLTPESGSTADLAEAPSTPVVTATTSDPSPTFPPQVATPAITTTSLVPTSPPTPERPTPTPTVRSFAAPILKTPEDGMHYSGRSASILLTWTSVGALSDDEFYVVHITHPRGVEYGWSKETSWQVPDYMYDLAPSSREVVWRVRVERFEGIGAPTSSKGGMPLGPFSNSRSFWWDTTFLSPLPPP